MTDHEPYEVLCALAAAGQLDAPEKAALNDHCDQCPACQHRLQDLMSIGWRLRLDAAIHACPGSLSAGSFERFRARAIREGIELRPNAARTSAWHALASAAAVFVIVVTLVFMPGRRKSPERLTMSDTAPIPTRQSLLAPVTTRKSTTSRATHAHLERRKSVAQLSVDAKDAVPTALQFPHVITARYSLLDPESATKPLRTGYPALSRSQISQIALFPKLNDSSTTSVASIGTFNRPIDIASIGKTLDFATNIRQVYFQLPTAQ